MNSRDIDLLSCYTNSSGGILLKILREFDRLKYFASKNSE